MRIYLFKMGLDHASVEGRHFIAGNMLDSTDTSINQLGKPENYGYSWRTETEQPIYMSDDQRQLPKKQVPDSVKVKYLITDTTRRKLPSASDSETAQEQQDTSCSIQ